MSVPYFRFYPSDFEADTSHLTMLEDGAYNRLLRLCWLTPGCSLPDDETWIMRRARARTDDEKEAIKSVLNEFFQRSKGRVLNKRLAAEHAHSVERSESAAKNSKKRWGADNALKNKETDTSKRIASTSNANQNQNQNHIIPLSKDNGAEARFASFLFQDGLQFLTDRDIPAERARSIIGKWRVAFGESEVANAVNVAIREDAAEPVSRIEAILKKRRSNREARERGGALGPIHEAR